MSHYQRLLNWWNNHQERRRKTYRENLRAALKGISR